MSEESFYIYANDEQLGPLSVSEIVEKIVSNEFKLSDFVYDEDSENWVTILNHSYIMKCVEGTDQSEEPTLVGQSENDEDIENIQEEPENHAVESKEDIEDNDLYLEKEWFVLRNEDRYGPFSQVEMVQMLASKILHEYDYVWKTDLKSWTKIAEMEDFGKSEIEKISNLYDVEQDIENHFFRRRYPRRLCNIPVVVQAGEKVYTGTGISLGESGVGLTIENADLKEQSNILLNFKPGDHLPAFSAECKIINITKNSDGALRCGVEFVKIDPEVQNQIVTFCHANRKKVQNKNKPE